MIDSKQKSNRSGSWMPKQIACHLTAKTHTVENAKIAHQALSSAACICVAT